MKKSTQSESLSKNGDDALQAAIDDGWNLNLSKDVLFESETNNKVKHNSKTLRHFNILTYIAPAYFMLIAGLLFVIYIRHFRLTSSSGGK